MRVVDTRIASLMMVLFIFVEGTTTPTPPISEATCPAVPASLLQAAGFSPACVASALANCYNPLPSVAIVDALQNVTEALETSKFRPQNCAELKGNGDMSSGIRKIFPLSCCPDRHVGVYCDQETDGGGWTVLQRRDNVTDREDFYRTWQEYVLGFGYVDKEFWLGLNIIHELTSASLQELRVDLHDYIEEHRWAKYGLFFIGNAASKYILKVGRYSGTAGDGLSENRHVGHPFTTHDQDNDEYKDNCAQLYKGGWWYDKCHISNLNGYQHVGKHDSYADGVGWRPWHGYHYSLKRTVMMIRPAYRQS